MVVKLKGNGYILGDNSGLSDSDPHQSRKLHVKKGHGIRTPALLEWNSSHETSRYIIRSLLRLNYHPQVAPLLDNPAGSGCARSLLQGRSFSDKLQI